MDNTGSSSRRKRSVISCRECHRRKQKCNRRQPCNHCLRRGKREACLYDIGDNEARFTLSRVKSTFQPIHSSMQVSANTILMASEKSKDNVSALGYSNDCKGTSAILHGLAESTSLLDNSHLAENSTMTLYQNIIRELPSRRQISALVKFFFENVAWHYDIVDGSSFISRLSEWDCLSVHQLKQSPHSLPNILKSFPALLFQVLAQALLFQPTQHDDILNDLKYAADMDLSDRAAQYSEAGHRLVGLFKKSDLTLDIVQAELMRVCFEKTTGAVIEGWHTLGAAIRYSQELGIHLIKPELTAYLETGNPSERELSRKLWFMLHLWDAHMAVVLGRPMSTRMNANDVPLPALWTYSSETGRDPQPYDVILCGYHTAYKFLQAIHELEKAENCRQIIKNIHDDILTNIANLPAWARAERSRHNEPPWLSAALETMFTNIHFVLFALHRPFVFVELRDRDSAIQSAMQILESQTRLFDQTPPLQYRAFSLVFATFDAMVLITAMHIRFANELIEYFPTSSRNIQWGLERLKLLCTKNSLAASAFNIVQRLYLRMLTSVSPTQSPHRHQEPTERNDLVYAREAEMAQVNCDSIPPIDFEDLLPPQPLNELLSYAPLNSPLGWPMESLGPEPLHIDVFNEVQERYWDDMPPDPQS